METYVVTIEALTGEVTKTIRSLVEAESHNDAWFIAVNGECHFDPTTDDEGRVWDGDEWCYTWVKSALVPSDKVHILNAFF